MMKESKSYRSLQILNVLFFIAVVAVNAMANLLPINGYSTGELSDMYPNLFVPAGFTFSIWGLIYILLLIFCIYQLKGIINGNKVRKEVLDKIGILFIVTCIFNISWIFAWHYLQVGLSIIVMLAFLVTLIILHRSLKIGTEATSKGEKYAVHIVFSIYLGWISIATIANITAGLVNANWDRFGLSEVFWTVTVIIIGTIITLLMLYKYNDIFYSLVPIWAFIGIISKRLSQGGAEAKPIVTTCIACIVVIAIGILLRAKKWFEY